MSDRPHLHLDFETRSTLDLKKVGADVYAEHPSTDILCMATATSREPVQLHLAKDGCLDDVISHVVEGLPVVAHNAPFELAIWNGVGVRKYDWPELKPEQTICTMAMAYAMSLPGALENAAASVGIKEQKDMQGHRIMLQLCKPKDTLEGGCIFCSGKGGNCKECYGTGNQFEWHTDLAKYERLYAYCKQDIEVERELFHRLVQLSPAEQALWQLDFKINRRGVQGDRKAAQAALQIAEMEGKRLNEEMRRLSGGAVATCSAVGQLTDYLHSLGVMVEGVAKVDVANALEGVLPIEARRVLELRQAAAKSSVKKLLPFIQSLGADGRLRGLHQYHGAGTGRWTGRRVQTQNLPRPKLAQAEIEEMFEILKSVN